jgi:hypothetical protein
MVRKSRNDSIDEGREQEGSGDVDVEGDIIIGELDQEGRGQTENARSKQTQGSLRDDVDQIINGIPAMYVLPSSPTLI